MTRNRCAIMACCIALMTHQCLASNVVVLELARIDDFLNPLENFEALIDVELPDVPGVNSVTAITPTNGTIDLHTDGGNRWSTDSFFDAVNDPDDIIDQIHGT